MQFDKERYSCLQPVKREVKIHEETQEVRLPDDMPDIGSVLGTWGQVLLRGKQWRNGSMQMNGGVMTWVMYMPEEGGVPQKLEVWLPFQLRWELPETKSDGSILIQCLLRSVDARTSASRKMVVRATVSVLAEAMVSEEVQLPKPADGPEDVYLYRRTYPLQLPVEVGEKAFSLDDVLTLPGTCPKLKKLMRFGLQPELIDRKVMSDKVVFRGSALVHILYLSQEDSLCAWDFEVPFSQYAELEKNYSQDAAARIFLAVTGLELDVGAEGQLELKASMTGQYVICDRLELELVEDAYSNHRTVSAKTETQALPAIRECDVQTVHIRQEAALEGSKVIDAAAYAAWPELQPTENGHQLCLAGHIQLLTCDADGAIREHRVRWENTREAPACQGDALWVSAALSGTPQVVVQPGEVAVQCDLMLAAEAVRQEQLDMIAELELGQLTDPDPDRPGVILRRCAGESLWQIAKSCGSDVEIIRMVNGIVDEPAAETMLLIPVV